MRFRDHIELLFPAGFTDPPGQLQAQAADPNLMTFIRFADALEADVTCGGGGQDQVVECDPGQ